jgi:hypothetical protein
MGAWASCICCYSEGARVGKVLDAFAGQNVASAKDNNLQKIVGRVVLASNQPFCAPVTGKPCVYYKTTVREERLQTSYYTDSNGRMHRNVYPVWYTIAESQQFQNFYLQDGTYKVFVPGSRGTCRIQSLKGGGTSGLFTGMPPPGVQAMINQVFAARGETFWGWGACAGMRTGRYNYTEESFDINEIVAALGVPTSAVDPYTNAPCKIMQPFAQDTLSEDWMKENNWTGLQRKSWETLLEQGGAVLLSDNTEQTAGIAISPIANLPQNMVVYAQSVDDFAGMYSNSVQLVTAVAQATPQEGTQGSANTQVVANAQPVVNAQPVGAQAQAKVSPYPQ